MGQRYIEMLRAILSPEQFIELDGARRWIPRSEQPPPDKRGNPGTKNNEQGLSLQSGETPSLGKGGNDSGAKEKGKNSGLKGPQGGTGNAGKGSPGT
mgnify:FL=1